MRASSCLAWLVAVLAFAAFDVAAQPARPTPTVGDAGPDAAALRASINETCDSNVSSWQSSCAREMSRLLDISLARFQANKTLVLARIHAADAHAKGDYYDAVATAAEACQARATRGDPDAFEACFRDRLPGIRDAARAVAQAGRDIHALELSDARVDAQERYKAGRDAWLASNPKP